MLAESLLHAPHTILGLRMRPFTHWHAFRLDVAESYFAGCAQELTLADALYTVALCAEKPRLPGDPLHLRDSVRRRITRRALRIGQRLARAANLKSSISDLKSASEQLALASLAASLTAYFTDHLAMPQCWQTEDGRPVRSPWYLYAVAILMRHGRYTERDAWCAQVAYSRHLALALAEAGGNDIPLVSDAEREALAEAGHSI